MAGHPGVIIFSSEVGIDKSSIDNVHRSSFKKKMKAGFQCEAETASFQHNSTESGHILERVLNHFGNTKNPP